MDKEKQGSIGPGHEEGRWAVKSTVFRQSSTHAFANERGESLVEILVSVATMSIIITAFLAALSTGAFSVALVRRQVTAENLARAQLEYVKDYEPYNEITQTTSGAYPTVTPIASGYTIAVTASPITTTTSDIQLITVSISHNGEQVFTIGDYKVNRVNQ